MIIDLHMHTFLSDGELVPSELIRRCHVNKYDVLAITDHADAGNIKILLKELLPAIEMANKYYDMKILPGVEITHVHPKGIKDCVDMARDNGAKIVVVHGETPVEDVFPGTNEAALKYGCDILAHPGPISEELGCLAAENNVRLELSFRKGNCLYNGHVLSVARKTGAQVVVNSDAHSPSDIFTEKLYSDVAYGAGMSDEEFKKMLEKNLEWVNTILK